MTYCASLCSRFITAIGIGESPVSQRLTVRSSRTSTSRANALAERPDRLIAARRISARSLSASDTCHTPKREAGGLQRGVEGLSDTATVERHHKTAFADFDVADSVRVLNAEVQIHKSSFRVGRDCPDTAKATLGHMSAQGAVIGQFKGLTPC